MAKSWKEYLNVFSIIFLSVLLVSCDSESLYGRTSYRSVSPCVGIFTRFSNGYMNWSVLDCGDSLILNPFNVVVLPNKLD